MTMLKFVISLAMVVELGMAANYTVGGPNGGWDTTSNVQTWPSSQTFRVGDNLIFQYSAMHSVAEVSESDYDSCQTSNAIQTYTDGNTVISLSSAGKRYFICGTPGHCTSGMKLQVDTTADTTTTSPSVLPPTSSANPPMSSPLPETSTKPLLDAPSIGSTPATSPSTFPPPPSPSSTTTDGFHFYSKYGIGLAMILPFAI